DAFVAEFNPLQSGNASLAYSSYLGGTDFDQANGIAVDGSGNAYVTGYTFSTNFPTKNPFQSQLAGKGTSDAFVTKIDPPASPASAALGAASVAPALLWTGFRPDDLPASTQAPAEGSPTQADI